MGIWRSNDPTTFDDVDQIVINETAPPPSIQGAASNVAILVGQFERGPESLTEVGGTQELYETFGKASSGGLTALKSKKFGRLKIIRTVAAAAVAAKEEFDSSSVDRIRFTAKWRGVYGNSIQVKIEAGSTVGKKYTIKDNTATAVLPTEIYDNVEIATATAATFAASALVDATILSSAAEPSNTVGFVSLAGGSSGSIADTDYEASIALAEVEKAGNFVFLDEYNSTRNGYLKVHVQNAPDKMVILAGPEVQTVAAAITDVANYRDTDGRIIYAYPWVKTTIDGVSQFVSPASFYASLLSQTAPNIDPAYTANAGFLAGITDLKYSLNRTNYVNLAAAGISAFELDSDIGVKIKSGVTTQIVNSSKIMVFRRRMADYLTESSARFLKNYQNAPNTVGNRRAVKAALLAFIEQQESAGLLPRDTEVQNGLAKLVDVEVLNTNASIAAGFFKILWKQRIFSSMRFIVIEAEIGESVVVTAAA